MLRIDEFESLFRAAHKEGFRLQPPPLRHVLLVDDLEASQAEPREALRGALERWLKPLRLQEPPRIEATGIGAFEGIEALLRHVQQHAPDLVVTYRNLGTDAWRWHYSLGAWVSALMRATDRAVLLLPHPREDTELGWKDAGLDDVLVLTGHLTGDHRLVNWGVRMTAPGGRLHLAHLEDDVLFARYMHAIERIGDIDTETARQRLAERLLQEPRDYAESCRQVLQRQRGDLELCVHVGWGHRIEDYRALKERTKADLLVLPTLEEGGVLAMRGAVYVLAVELTRIPLLLV